VTLPWFKPEPVRILPLPDVSGWPDGLYLHPFGMMVALATLVGVLVATDKARREGLNPRIVAELAGHVLIGGFVLGHVLDAVFYHWDTVRERPLFVLELWNGLSSFGGFVGAIVGGLVWSARRGYSLLVFADPIAFGFPFGWIFGRLGCFIAHDHPGSVSDFVLAVDAYRTPELLPPWQPRHDLGLYEALYTALVAAVFYVLGRRSRPRGLYLALLPIVYAPARFALDFLRATDIPGADPRFLGLTPGHYGSIALLLAGLALAARVRRGPAVEPPNEALLRPKPEVDLAALEAASREKNPAAREDEPGVVDELRGGRPDEP
jgi:phosphatidylglycerol:prolipoprotein diacylglycerol transferase